MGIFKTKLRACDRGEREREREGGFLPLILAVNFELRCCHVKTDGAFVGVASLGHRLHEHLQPRLDGAGRREAALVADQCRVAPKLCLIIKFVRIKECFKGERKVEVCVIMVWSGETALLDMTNLNDSLKVVEDLTPDLHSLAVGGSSSWNHKKFLGFACQSTHIANFS